MYYKIHNSHCTWDIEPLLKICYRHYTFTYFIHSHILYNYFVVCQVLSNFFYHDKGTGVLLKFRFLLDVNLKTIAIHLFRDIDWLRLSKLLYVIRWQDDVATYIFFKRHFHHQGCIFFFWSIEQYADMLFNYSIIHNLL